MSTEPTSGADGPATTPIDPASLREDVVAAAGSWRCR